MIIYLINTYLIIQLNKIPFQNSNNTKMQNILFLLIGIMVLLTLFVDTPTIAYSPVYKTTENFSALNYYRNLGVFGNPNLSAFILIALIFAYLDMSEKISKKSMCYIAIVVFISVQEMSSRTMIVTFFLTLIICLSALGKLIVMFVLFFSAALLFYSLDTNTPLFIRLFEDFGSSASRLNMFFDSSLGVKSGYFDSDLTAGQVFMGYFFIPVHIINYFFIRGSNKYLITSIFISGLAGVGMMSGYITSLLVFLLLFRKVLNAS